MPTFLILQTTYDALHIGLFSGSQLLGCVIEDKHAASAQLLVSLDALLKAHGHTVASLDSIAAVCGPAPFTSLRTVLTCLNGIAYVSHTPLMPLDGLALFLDEHASQQYPTTVALFNAFNKEMYYGFYDQHAQLHTGYAPCSKIIELLKETFPGQDSIRFIGNGVALCAQELAQELGQRVYIPHEVPTAATLPFLGSCVADAHVAGRQQFVDELFPMYLKSIVI